MKLAKILGILALIYVLLVTVFESLLGYFQPQGPGTLTITTTDDDGEAHDRVLSELESDGKVYVAVNHWPRAWYGHLLANPEVGIRRGGADGTQQAYTAVPVTGDEKAQVATDNPTGIVFRILTGFPPRHFIRLDPTGEAEPASDDPA